MSFEKLFPGALRSDITRELVEYIKTYLKEKGLSLTDEEIQKLADKVAASAITSIEADTHQALGELESQTNPTIDGGSPSSAPATLGFDGGGPSDEGRAPAIYP